MLAALLATGAAGYRPETIVADLRADVDRQVNVLDHVQPLRMVVGVGARALPAHAQKDQNVRSAARKDRNVRAPRVPSPNNTWLTLLAEHGVLGFAFFAAFMLRGIALMWRATAEFQTRAPARTSGPRRSASSASRGSCAPRTFSTDCLCCSSSGAPWASASARR
jgi:hypothetical protein